MVLTTRLEHHSNDLPWRARVRTVQVAALPDGTLDLEDLDRRLADDAGRIALLAISGASNVTGVVPPIHEIAEKVHAVGGRILVDAAQIAAHRPIDMRAHDDPGHLDFVTLSAHKMYAPYGAGVVVGPRSAFGAVPDQPGGGTVKAVMAGAVSWADLPDREEAGSPNVLGAMALAAAATTPSRVGLDRIAAHESELTRYAIDRLAAVPGLTIHGPSDTSGPTARLGVISFTLAGIDHTLVAAILGYEHGVGVRSGCFCAQPYVGHLLGLDRPPPSPGSTGSGMVTSATRRGWCGSASPVTPTPRHRSHRRRVAADRRRQRHWHLPSRHRRLISPRRPHRTDAVLPRRTVIVHLSHRRRDSGPIRLRTLPA